ncbi:hypothetical protein PCASD_03657 [Puccinia coronata f. sp. avenae]|uniref:Auxin efflux carrier n=1 Tax=Puccinia coronata f. sp. avenae TaxID=200324 RepID=A0A2N5V9Q1_9BASI|nr:hypothetical protein PCASD_03657 [Puccinia coronata f. sp. avenae]
MALAVIPIVLTVLTSIIQIALFCIAGYIAAIRGIIDSKCRRQLNRLNIGIFTPALVFGKVAFFLTPEKLAGLWVIPASFALITSVSFASAWCLGKMFQLSRAQFRVAIAGAMFMNTNTIPIALIQSLSMSLDKLKINSLDTPDKELGRAFSYLAIYSLLGSLLRWSYGVRLLQPAEQTDVDTGEFRKRCAREDCEKVDFPSSVDNDNKTHAEEFAMPTFVDLAVPTRTQGAYRISCATAFSSDSDILGSPSKANVRFSYPTAFGAYGSNGARIGSMRMSSATAFSVDSEITHCDIAGDTFKERRKSCRRGQQQTRPETQSFHDISIFLDELPRLQPICENENHNGEVTEALTPSVRDKIASPLPEEAQCTNRRRLPDVIDRVKVPSGVMKLIQVFQRFLNPPLISSVLSIAIACVPPVQQWLSGVQILRNFLNSAGNASIPITLIVLGSFFSSSTSHQSSIKSVKGNKHAPHIEPSSRSSSKNQSTTIALSLISRHLLTPMILLPLMYILSKFTRVTIFADPIFLLTTVLLVGAPPAITLAQMATEQDGDLDKLVSRLLFCSFVFITPLTTLLLVGVSVMIHDTHKL